MADLLYQVVSVNVDSLNRFEDGAEITIDTLMQAGILKKSGDALNRAGMAIVKSCIIIELLIYGVIPIANNEA